MWEGQEAFSLLSQRKSGLAVWETKSPPTPVMMARYSQGWRKGVWLNSHLCKRVMFETRFILESLTYGLEEMLNNAQYANSAPLAQFKVL